MDVMNGSTKLEQEVAAMQAVPAPTTPAALSEGGKTYLATMSRALISALDRAATSIDTVRELMTLGKVGSPSRMELTKALDEVAATLGGVTDLEVRLAALSSAGVTDGEVQTTIRRAVAEVER